MTTRERIVVKILLIIARMMAEEPKLQQELYHLSNHIQQARYEEAT